MSLQLQQKPLGNLSLTISPTHIHVSKNLPLTDMLKNIFDGQMALIAESEKALADWLYFVSIGKNL